MVPPQVKEVLLKVVLGYQGNNDIDYECNNFVSNGLLIKRLWSNSYIHTVRRKLSSINKNVPEIVHEMVSGEQINQVPPGSKTDVESSLNTVTCNVIITPDSGDLLKNPIKLAKA